MAAEIELDARGRRLSCRATHLTRFAARPTIPRWTAAASC